MHRGMGGRSRLTFKDLRTNAANSRIPPPLAELAGNFRGEHSLRFYSHREISPGWLTIHIFFSAIHHRVHQSNSGAFTE